MSPILLIHGYASEGADHTPEQIYGSLPSDLRQRFGNDSVLELDLSRWISLSDGITLDDVSFAMDRALRKSHSGLLKNGFHVIIHSTGALVVRNWIRLFSPKPCPIENIIHLAGANFGSGLAHIGRGQLARWGRQVMGTDRGVKILNELEFGSTKTLDLHRHFTLQGNDMYHDYQVQEFCVIGSQTLKALRQIPIRYVKEDSSDNTVRTSAGNLNYNFITVRPSEDSLSLTTRKREQLMEQRIEDQHLDIDAYEVDLSAIASKRESVPYCVAYETAHFGEAIGLVFGEKNRTAVLPLIFRALETPYDLTAYSETAEFFEKERLRTFERASKLKWGLLEWDKQKQYEGHAQLIFRLRDQFGTPVENFDVTIKSTPPGTKKNKLERMIEDKHLNQKTKGIITFYLRTQRFDAKKKSWIELLEDAPTVHLEVTACEAHSQEIGFVPLNVKLTPTQLRAVFQTFRTTIVDVTLLRLPSPKVFSIKKSKV